MAKPLNKMMPEPVPAGVTAEQVEQARTLLRGLFPNIDKEGEEKVIASLVPAGQPPKTVNIGMYANDRIGGNPESLANIEANRKNLKAVHAASIKALKEHQEK